MILSLPMFRATEMMIRTGKGQGSLLAEQEQQPEQHQHIKPTPACHPEKDCSSLEMASATIPVPSLSTSGEDDDPNLVDWCEQDPGHPRNWKSSRKWIAVILGVFVEKNLPDVLPLAKRGQLAHLSDLCVL